MMGTSESQHKGVIPQLCEKLFEKTAFMSSECEDLSFSVEVKGLRDLLIKPCYAHNCSNFLW